MTIRTFILFSGLAFSILLIGCALSINPVITESDAIFDARLLGNWKDISSSDQASISRGTANSYEIEYTSDGKTGRFEARLGHLGEHLILDVWPKLHIGDLSDPYADMLIAGHLQLFLEVSDNEIAVATIDPDSLLSSLQSGKVKLPYEHSTEFILSGTTEELRENLGPYFANPTVLPKREEWRHARRSTAKPNLPVNVPCFEASAWREADQIFRRDPHWVGADVASSVDLGGHRTLWLFGDTWIDASGKGTRKGARMVSNSVAIQVGPDPTTAAISFYWGRDANGKPDAMFPDRNGESLWFGNGVRVGDRLILFFARTIRNTGVGIGFEHVGWTAIMVTNPDSEPSSWQMHELETPINPLGILVGFAAVQKLDGYIVALGSQNPVKSHPIFAARWPIDEVRRGNLLHPEWWAGDRLGWIPDSSDAQRYPLFNDGQSELTIHFDDLSQRFISVQTAGFGAADILMRAAPSFTGPWSDLRMVYRPPEYYIPNIMIYAGKAHPELTGADLILTYATNTFKFEEQLTDSLIYYPRFVRLTRCR
ncbi:MAG: DUF4185 domain-containing protein [Planctomycetes bacterium]|nr:DUF4185 domain-containing protein [Planctomycetota bacterium]